MSILSAIWFFHLYSFKKYYIYLRLCAYFNIYIEIL